MSTNPVVIIVNVFEHACLCEFEADVYKGWRSMAFTSADRTIHAHRTARTAQPYRWNNLLAMQWN